MSYVMCVDPDWWPFEAIDERGNHVGIAAELIELVASRAKVPIAVHPALTWEESVAASKVGTCQLASFINQTPEREQWLIFTEPLLVDPNVLIVREDSPPLGDLATAKGRSIALPKESSIYTRVQKEFPNLKLIGTNSEYEAFGMVSNRKADMTLRSRIVAGQNIKEKGWFNLKIASEVPGYENVLRMGVLKSEPALRDKLNEGISTLTKAERDKIINRHVEIKMVTDVKTDYTPAIWMAVLLVAVSVTSLWWMRRLSALNRQLQQLSVTDALTGLYNRTALSATFQIDLERAQRYGRPLSIVLLDLDHFKSINDEFGHLVGDQVLIESASIIRKTVRQVDGIYRWGGEEFLIVCPETPPGQVWNLTKRILDGVRTHRFATGKPTTVSAGIANMGTGDTLSTLIQRADEALYCAKAAGRDCIHIAPDPSPHPIDAVTQPQSVVQLVWHDAYACGHPVIDAQHKDLFAQTNLLINALIANLPKEEIANRIEQLVGKLVTHFKDEEAILVAVGFSGQVRHAQLHAELIERANSLVSNLLKGTLSFGEVIEFLANDVVAKHMLVSDREFYSLVGHV